MASLYEQLEKMTVVVADTGDINSIQKFTPRDATTNPSLITAAAQMDEYQEIVDATLRAAREEAGKDAETKDVLAIAIDQLSVEFGRRILDIVPGRVSTEVDARLSYDTEATIAKARKLIGAYEKAGVSRDRVLIKIAATWEGVRAADQLEDEGIHCNLTLMFGLHQAVACAEAGVTLISPFVGRILDWHKKNTGRKQYPSHEDPGVLSVSEIYTYYKKYDYKTEVMGASFRNLGEICELAGCDLLTISPKFLAQLKEQTGELPRKLDATKAKAADVERLEMNERVFRKMHGEDKMANEKLDEGIAGFSKAIVALEQLLGERLAQLEGATKRGRVARDFFKAFDLDGDGVITREEWCGTDAVFDAVDLDGDGRITPEELAASIGASHIL